MWGPLPALSEDSMSSERGLTPHVFEQLFYRIKEVMWWHFLNCLLVNDFSEEKFKLELTLLQEQVKHADKELTYNCVCSFLEVILVLGI
jgi:kinesin family member 15